MSSGATARERPGWLGRESEKIPEYRLSEMRFFHRALDEIGKNVCYPLRKRRAVVAPAPYGHFADPKESRRLCVAAEDYLEYEIVPTDGEPGFEARSSYEFGTRWHGTV
jgi:hypothetical protein